MAIAFLRGCIGWMECTQPCKPDPSRVMCVANRRRGSCVPPALIMSPMPLSIFSYQSTRYSQQRCTSYNKVIYSSVFVNTQLHKALEVIGSVSWQSRLVICMTRTEFRFIEPSHYIASYCKIEILPPDKYYILTTSCRPELSQIIAFFHIFVASLCVHFCHCNSTKILIFV